jgi:tetratricopeptide (TPR) repeat protein
MQRFHLFNNTNDINSAVSQQRKAVDLLLMGSPDRHLYLSSLGTILLFRFERLREDEDLELAINSLREAITVTPPKSTSRISPLNSLGRSYFCRFQLSGEIQDLDFAILQLSEAISLTPEHHVHRPRCLSNLGQAFMKRYEQSHDLDDISSAIDHLREAVSLLPDDSPRRSSYLNELGRWSVIRALCSQQVQRIIQEEFPLLAMLSSSSKSTNTTPSDYVEDSSRAERILHVRDIMLQIVPILRSSSVSTNGIPGDRMTALMEWAHIAHGLEDLTSASEAYEAAILLLPRVVWIGLSAVDQLKQMDSNIQSLSCDAAACMFTRAQSEPEFYQQHLACAVELLDQGRSILWSQTSQLRQDLSKLRDVDLQLAEDLDHIGSLLGRRCFQDSLSEDNAQLYRRSAEHWEELIYHIRKLPGFEHFLLPPPISELRKAAEEGPVVIVNASQYRCDALIVPHEGDLVLVPQADIQTLALQHQQMLDSERLRYGRPFTVSPAQQQQHGTLDRLLDQTWTLVGEPIITQLEAHGMLGSGPSSTCRVWWCLTGSLAFLPIHASSPLPDDPSIQPLGMMDLVISSYTHYISTPSGTTAESIFIIFDAGSRSA